MTVQEANAVKNDILSGRRTWDDNILAEANRALGGGGGGFPQFSFSFETEQKVAYEKLRPFYENVLRLAKGDFNLATRILEFTYTQGMRESEQEYQQQTREQAYQFPQERRGFMEGLNQRGMLRSQMRATGQRPGEYELGESQAIRAEAVRRALENRRENLTKGREFGLEEKGRAFEREEIGQRREWEKEASSMASDKFNREMSKYGIELQKFQTEEARRARAEDREFQLRLAKGEI